MGNSRKRMENFDLVKLILCKQQLFKCFILKHLFYLNKKHKDDTLVFILPSAILEVAFVSFESRLSQQ